MTWILRRLREPSTWRGLVLIGSAFGISLEPQQWDAITVAGMALIGLIEAFRKEPEREVEEMMKEDRPWLTDGEKAAHEAGKQSNQ